MSAPTELPTWATSGDRTDPGVVKRALGWVFGEKPAHEHMNWWQHLVGKWIEHLSERSIVQHDTIEDMIDDGGLGLVGFVGDGPGGCESWSTEWTKNDVDVSGAVGGKADAIATDSVRMFVVGSISGSAKLAALDIKTGGEVWSVPFAFTVTTLFLHSDGRFLVWGRLDHGVASLTVWDVDTGALLNTIGYANLVDGISDGQLLFLVSSTGTLLSAYSNYEVPGGQVLQWTSNLSTLPTPPGTPNKIATDGQRVFVGCTPAATDNFAVFLRDGTFIGTDKVETAGGSWPTISGMFANEDNVFVTGDSKELGAIPVAQQVPVGAAGYPGLGSNNRGLFDVGNQAVTISTFGDFIAALSETYLSGIKNVGGDGLISIARVPSTQSAGLAVAFTDEFDSAMTACAIAKTHFAYGGEENSDGVALVCRKLPCAGGLTLRRVSEQSPFRAPSFDKVIGVRR